MPLMISLFLLSAAHAQELGWLPGILSEAPVGPAAPMCWSNPRDDLGLRQQCARDLCGLPGNVPSAFRNGTELEGFVPSLEARTEIDQALTRLRAASDRLRQGYEVLLTRIEEKAQQEARWIASPWYAFEPYLGFRVENGRIGFVLLLTGKESPVLVAGLREWMRNSEEALQNNLWIRLQLGMIDTNQAVAHLSNRLLEIEERLSSLPDEHPQKAALSAELEVIQRELARPGGIDLEDFRVVYQRHASLYRRLPPRIPVYDDSAAAPEREGGEAASAEPNAETGVPAEATPPTPAAVDTSSPADRPIHMYDEHCQAACMTALREILTPEHLAKKIADMRKYLATQDERLLRCEQGLLYHAQRGMLPGQQPLARERVLSALARVTATPWWSAHTRQAFTAHIQNAVQVTTQIRGNNVGENALAYANALIDNFSFAVDFSGAWDSITDMSQPANLPYRYVMADCPSGLATPSDYMSMDIARPELHVSPFSCEHQVTGTDIVAHELGHALSAFMEANLASGPSYRTYLATRACVAGQTPLVTATARVGHNPFISGHGTVEEDMADWVGATAALPNSPPFMCPFIYQGPDFAPYALDLVVQRDGASHSPELLRVMRIWQQGRGELPPSCAQVMRSYEGVVEARSCP